MKIKLLGLLVLAVFLTAVSQAAPSFKEGKWQINSKIEVQGSQYQIPPVQFTQCLDKKNFMPHKKEDGADCKMTKQSISGNTVSWEISCKGKRGNSNGKGYVTYSGDQMTGETVFTFDGKENMSANNKMTGRWIGACN